MTEQPARQQSDLAEMVEMLLDKGVVINADIVVSIGDTELLGVKIRAAIASFETAAEYGLEFPEGTDMDRVEAAAKRNRGEELPDGDEPIRVTQSASAEADDDADEGSESVRERIFASPTAPSPGGTSGTSRSANTEETQPSTDPDDGTVTEDDSDETDGDGTDEEGAEE